MRIRRGVVSVCNSCGIPRMSRERAMARAKFFLHSTWRDLCRAAGAVERMSVGKIAGAWSEGDFYQGSPECKEATVDCLRS